MNFKEQYTTADVLSEAIILDKNTVEQGKIMLSNDAYALGQLLETLANRLVK